MKTGIESLGRLHIQAILLIIVVFAIGVLGGITFERAQGPRDRHHPRGKIPPELAEGLSLSQDQERRMMEILDRNRPRTEAVLKEFLPRLRSIADSVRAEVRAVLTPEQQKIFDSKPPLPFGMDKGLPPGVHPHGGPEFDDRRPGHPPDGPPRARRPEGGPPPGEDPRPADRDSTEIPLSNQSAPF